MLLTDLLQEFVLNCDCRHLSSKTTSNYLKQIGYLLHYMEAEHSVTQLDKIPPRHIKAFMIMKMKEGNDFFNIRN